MSLESCPQGLLSFIWSSPQYSNTKEWAQKIAKYRITPRMWLKPLPSSFVHLKEAAGPGEARQWRAQRVFNAGLCQRWEHQRLHISLTSLEPSCLFTQDKWSQSRLSKLVCDFFRYDAQTAWPDCHLAEILLSKISDTQWLDNSCILPDLKA